jgi:hypothetical protein
MAAIHWTNDDAGYEGWLSAHPSGFMANLSNPPRGEYFRIHRATHKLPDRSRPDSLNPRTGNRYSKVTAETIGELVDWARLKLSALGRIGDHYCKTCTPTDDSPVESAPTADLTEYTLRADRMRARGRVKRPVGVPRPKVVQGTATFFFRDPHVRAWVLDRADGRCELCGTAPFLTEDEEPFLESHHLVMLSEGGPDTPNNTAALCPNCHRNLHYGIERMELCERLTRVIIEKEAAAAGS